MFNIDGDQGWGGYEQNGLGYSGRFFCLTEESDEEDDGPLCPVCDDEDDEGMLLTFDEESENVQVVEESV